MNKQSIKLPCDYCNKYIDVKKWEIFGKYKRLHHFCNQNCRYNFQKTNKWKNPFLGKKHSEETKKRISINKKGKPSWHKGKKRSQETKLKLSLIRKQYFLLHPEAREKIKQRQIGKKQSKETILKRILKNSGKKRTIEQRRRIANSIPRGMYNHFWRGGVSKENHKLRNSSEYKLWRKSVFERDNWTCRECGKRGYIIHPHHIKSWSEFPELRFEENNGITLCINCHKKTDNFAKNKIN